MKKFKVGDIVTVRLWDDMVTEFGLFKGIGILADGIFLPSMRRYCGLKFEIVAISDDGYYKLKGVDTCYFSGDMFVESKNKQSGVYRLTIEAVDDIITATLFKYNRTVESVAKACDSSNAESLKASVNDVVKTLFDIIPNCVLTVNKKQKTRKAVSVYSGKEVSVC